MIRFTLTTAPTLAILLLCGSPSRIEASGDTPITIKDGGSILLLPGGLDAGTNWTYSRNEVRHRNGNGVLTRVEITEAGADLCKGDKKCGIDPAKPWTIKVSHGSGWVTIGSISGNKGLHLTHHKLPFDQWRKTANTDEREFGHGDGHYIGGIKVNGSATSLCSGKGGCVVTVTYTTP
jgi:hypothetical protein